MGRKRTGNSLYQPIQLTTKVLFDNGLLPVITVHKANLTWKGGDAIQLSAYKTEQGTHLQFEYSYSNATMDGLEHLDYTIDLTPVPSNLGNGQVWYFICPTTGKRCRKLYLNPQTYTFTSRAAFPKGWYYPSQRHSKYNRWLERYFKLEEEIKALEQQPHRKTYRGQPTRTARHLQALKEKLEVYQNQKEPSLLAHNQRALKLL